MISIQLNLFVIYGHRSKIRTSQYIILDISVYTQLHIIPAYLIRGFIHIVNNVQSILLMMN